MFEAIVVDDERMIRTGISSFINNNDTGFEVIHTFKDGAEAIEHLQSHDAALVISDIKMVNVSGIELARYIYENKPHIKIILLSGYAEFEYAKAAMQYNVEDYLTKPTDFGELKQLLLKIKETLEKAENADVNIFLDKVKQLYANLLSGKSDDAVAVLETLLSGNRHDGVYLGQFASNLFEIIFNRLHANLKVQFISEKFDYKKLIDMDSRDKISNYSAQLLRNITAQLSADSDNDSEGASNAVVAKIIQFVNEHYSENISMQDAAEKVFFNPAYFSRFFKKQTGENFSDYLLRVRMENAVKFLRENKKITDISRDCGYSSSGYFTRIFKEYYKCTPSEYLRKFSS